MARHPVLHTVCHFGAKFGLQVATPAHCLAACCTQLLRTTPHRLWLYVDDLFLIQLQKAKIKENVALIVALLAVLGVSILAQRGVDGRSTLTARQSISPLKNLQNSETLSLVFMVERQRREFEAFRTQNNKALLRFPNIFGAGPAEPSIKKLFSC